MEAQEAVVLLVGPARLEMHPIDLEAIAGMAHLLINQSAQMLEGDELGSWSVEGCLDSCDDACFSLFGIVHGSSVGVDVGQGKLFTSELVVGEDGPANGQQCESVECCNDQFVFHATIVGPGRGQGNA